jgi:hypothetical protein
MADDTIRYDDVCLYHEDSDKVKPIIKWLEKNKVPYKDLAYDDGAVCRANLSTWPWGEQGIQHEISFPILTYRDVRYEGTPLHAVMEKVNKVSELPKDFLNKVE